MKRIKSLVALLAVAAMLFMLPDNTLTASAAEPVTYAVKYIESANDWHFQAGVSAFDESQPHRELYYLNEALKDGDLVVVYNDSANADNLNLKNVRLNNLTVVSTASFTIVNAGTIDNLYILEGTSSAINAEVNNAFVYDSVLLNFGGNVKKLTLYCEDEVLSDIGCSGTLGHFNAPSSTLPRTFYDCYNFAANTFSLDDGCLQTAYEHYTTTAPAVTPAPQQPSGGSSSEYDDVPKTGDSYAALWFACAAVVFGAASVYVGKKH